MSLAQLSSLLPLPDDELRQMLDYANTLSKQAAAERFIDLLGESPLSMEFISAFNSSRQDPTVKPTAQPTAQPAWGATGVPKPTRKQGKKKAPLHVPAARQVQNTVYEAQGTAYVKKNEDDYMSNSKKPTPAAGSLTTQPAAIQAPTPRAPPSAAGSLISDFKTKSNNASHKNLRTASPAPTGPPRSTKINITGGTSMHGASAVLNQLDAAIRTLEVSTNSSLSDNIKRKCNCIGARHPLLAAAPNCLNCGKVICVKEGFGPCTFCNTPLLSTTEVQGMISSLREERGREKMALDNSTHRRADVAKKAAPFTAFKNEGMLSPAEAKAKEHRDKLLAFQSQNAKRTTVRDEAADFDVPVAGTGSMWASPAERAKELKRQQKVLAEQEWNARPEYEKRRQVVSIDLVKGKVVRRMGAVEKPQYGQAESEEEVEEVVGQSSGNQGGGTFSRNPLLGGMIRPVWHAGAKGKGAEVEGEQGRKKTWRRVQDDMDDNEEIILDGGAFGGRRLEG